jgi:hypothetical protein
LVVDEIAVVLAPKCIVDLVVVVEAVVAVVEAMVDNIVVDLVIFFDSSYPFFVYVFRFFF